MSELLLFQWTRIENQNLIYMELKFIIELTQSLQITIQFITLKIT
jgi:hypothetical protein